MDQNPKVDPEIASSLRGQAIVNLSQGKYSEAGGLYRRELAIRERALGPNHPDVAGTLFDLASLYQSQGKYVDAEGLYKRALAIEEQASGANGLNMVGTLGRLASLESQRGEIRKALTWSRKATAAIVAHAFSEAFSPQTSGAQRPGETAGVVERHSGYFVDHIANIASASRQGLEPIPRLRDEALEIAQWVNLSAAAAAIQQMASRFGSNGGALAALVRESQDLSAASRDRDRRLIDALSKSEGQQNRPEIEALRKQATAIESRMASVAARLEKEFPDYASLASPKPLKSEEVRKLLGADEALVFFLAGNNESYVFALTRESFDWLTIPIGWKSLSDKVSAFRHGLDVDALINSADAGKPELFDLGVAYELYAALLAPVDSVIKDKANLLVVATGALTALPFTCC